MVSLWVCFLLGGPSLSKSRTVFRVFDHAPLLRDDALLLALFLLFFLLARARLLAYLFLQVLGSPGATDRWASKILTGWSRSKSGSCFTEVFCFLVSMLAAWRNSALSKQSFACDLRHFFRVLRQLRVLVEVRDGAAARGKPLRNHAAEELVAVHLALQLHFLLGEALRPPQASCLHETADVVGLDERFAGPLLGLVWVPVLVRGDETGFVAFGEAGLLFGGPRGELSESGVLLGLCARFFRGG